MEVKIPSVGDTERREPRSVLDEPVMVLLSRTGEYAIRTGLVLEARGRRFAVMACAQFPNHDGSWLDESEPAIGSYIGGCPFGHGGKDDKKKVPHRVVTLLGAITVGALVICEEDAFSVKIQAVRDKLFEGRHAAAQARRQVGAR